MGKSQMIGYERALAMTMERVRPLKENRSVDLADSLGRVLFEDVRSRVYSPSADASMKDGYAVRSGDIAGASPENPVRIDVIGTAAAGIPANETVRAGTAVRILTGAAVPDGADAVLAEEFTRLEEKSLVVFNTAEAGRNILARGADVAVDEIVAKKGRRLTPGMISIVTAGGHGRLSVYRRPRVAILATGDELVVPGKPLAEGKLYASNLEMLKAWCHRYDMSTTYHILTDKPDLITQTVRSLMSTHDALITSGGAWTGDRDFVARCLGALEWEKVFQYIRIGPGKPVGFGLLNEKPVFLLPGGPPSNLTAFLQIALPGLLRLGGHHATSLPRMKVALKEAVFSRREDWTQFIYGRFESGDTHTLFCPLMLDSRLKSMALAQGVIAVPEGVKSYPAGTVVDARVF